MRRDETGCDGRREDVKMIGDDMIRHNEESCRDHAKPAHRGLGWSYSSETSHEKRLSGCLQTPKATLLTQRHNSS